MSKDIGTLIKALGSYIVIKPEVSKKESAGGLLLPSQKDNKSTTGVIVAVGPGEQKEGALVPLDSNLRINAKVLFQKYAGTEVEIAGEMLLILKASDILAIML